MLRLLLIPIVLLAMLLVSMRLSVRADEPVADLTYINRGDVNTLDLNRMSWAQDIRLAYALWEGLYTLNPRTLQPIPGAAERIEISPDGRVYTFHLRPEGRWTNGDPVIAGDFVFAWRRMLENPDEYSSLFHCIVGAQAYQEAFAAESAYLAEHGDRDDDPARPPAPDFGVFGVDVIDALTLRVRLNEPTAYFPSLTAFPPFFPSHARSMQPFAIIDQATGRVRYSEDFTHPPHLVTNGPYRLADWSFKRRVRIEASEYYWNRDIVGPQIIDQVAAEDPFAMYLMYHSGAVDWLLQVEQGVAAELLERRAPDLHTFPGFGTYFYSFNCQPTFSDGRPNPFADPRVRQAFAMALNKQPIVDTITRTGEQVIDTYIPPTIFEGYPSPGGLERDPDRARALLAEAGYPGGRGLPTVTLIYNTGSHHGDIAQICRRQWLDELGVDVELQGIELASFRERLNKKEYMIARASWMGDYNDPSTFTDKYRSTSHGNDAGWVNAEYDALLDQAIPETNAATRLQLLAQAEGILNREVPIIPIYAYTNSFMIRQGISGIPLHPQALFVYHTIDVGARGD